MHAGGPHLRPAGRACRRLVVSPSHGGAVPQRQVQLRGRHRPRERPPLPSPSTRSACGSPGPIRTIHRASTSVACTPHVRSVFDRNRRLRPGHEARQQLVDAVRGDRRGDRCRRPRPAGRVGVHAVHGRLVRLATRPERQRRAAPAGTPSTPGRQVPSPACAPVPRARPGTSRAVRRRGQFVDDVVGLVDVDRRRCVPRRPRWPPTGGCRRRAAAGRAPSSRGTSAPIAVSSARAAASPSSWPSRAQRVDQ